MQAICKNGHWSSFKLPKGMKLAYYSCDECGEALQAAKVVFCYECSTEGIEEDVHKSPSVFPMPDGTRVVRWVLPVSAKTCPKGHTVEKKWYYG